MILIKRTPHKKDVRVKERFMEHGFQLVEGYLCHFWNPVLGLYDREMFQETRRIVYYATESMAEYRYSPNYYSAQDK